MKKKKKKSRRARTKHKIKEANLSKPKAHKVVEIIFEDGRVDYAAYQYGYKPLNIANCWISLDGTIYDGTIYGEKLPVSWRYIKGG